MPMIDSHRKTAGKEKDKGHSKLIRGQRDSYATKLIKKERQNDILLVKSLPIHAY
jgi:hypothetical protein